MKNRIFINLRTKVLYLLAFVFAVLLFGGVYALFCEKTESASADNSYTWSDTDFDYYDDTQTSYMVSYCSSGAYNTEIPSVYNGKPVVAIGAYAFEMASSIRYLTIPESITYIEGRAFTGLSNLAAINSTVSGVYNIPDSVTYIGQYAFYYNKKLVTLNLGSGLEYIGQCAFQDCTNLVTVTTIPSSVCYIGTGAFKNCSALTTATFESITGWYYSSYSSGNEFSISYFTYAANTLTTINGTYKLLHDEVAPTVTGISDYDFFNSFKTVSYSDPSNGYNNYGTSGIASAMYSFNTYGDFPSSGDTSFSSGKNFIDAGNYTIEICDYAGNWTVIHFTIDLTAPTLTLSGVDSGGFTNGSVSATWSTTISGVASTSRANSNDVLTVMYSYSTTATFPTEASSSYTSGTSLTTAGNYFMTITDSAKNKTTYTFTIDLTAPTLTLSGVTNGGATNTSVSASWTTTASGVTSQRSNTNDTLTVKYSYTTVGIFPTSASTSYSSGTSITTAGNYYMTITDSAGNSTSYTFTIDLTAPTLTLSGVTDGGFTNSSVSASWSLRVTTVSGTALSYDDDVLTVMYSYNTSASFPSSASTSYAGTSLSEAGNYLMTITDSAGNTTSYTFTIDLTAPTLTLSEVTDGGFTNGSVSASWSTTVNGVASQLSNSSDELTVLYAYSTKATFPSARADYASGTSLSDAGNYTITITDSAGNSTSYTFTIDLTAPTLTLTGVTDGGFTNGSVSASWSTTASGVLSTELANANDVLTVKYTYNTNSSFPTSASDSYTSGTSITAAGNYYMTITDSAGNSTSYTFTIDLTAPTLTLKGVTDGGFTNASVYATWTETTSGVAGTSLANANDALTVKYSVDTTSTFPSEAANAYASGTYLTSVGNYLIIITDKAGNSTSYTFTIDTTAPILTLSGVSNGGFTNGSVSASWSTTASGVASTALANANDVLTVMYSYSTTATFPTEASSSYTSGASITTAGNYYMTITDSAGNSTSYTFTIDKTAPTLTLTGVSNGGFTNGGVYANWSTSSDGVASTALSNDNDALTVKYAYSTSSSFPTSAANAYAAKDTLSAAGNYLIVIFDSAGNSTSYTFTIDLTAPTLTLTGVSNGGFTNGSVSASWSTSVEGTSGALANSGDALTVTYSSSTSSAFPSSASTSYASGTSLSDAGNYKMIISDKAGNATTYTFTIDKVAPTLTLSGVTNGGFTNTDVSATWSTTVNGVASQLSNANDALSVKYSYLTSSSFPSSATTAYTKSASLSAAGNYLIVITDSAGNSTSYTFTIDLTAPTLTLTGVSDGGFTNGSVSATWSTTASGVASTALSNANDVLTVTYASNTSSAFPTSASTSYASGTSLSDAGNYKIIITDSAGNSTSYTFTIDKTAPTLTLSGVTNGGFTNTSVSATWSTTVEGVSGARSNSNDVLTVTYASNTSASFPSSASTSYASGTSITTAGNYLMIITDSAGNKTTYKFTIDLTAPTLTLTGVSDGGFTNGSVSASWSTSVEGVTSQLSNSSDSLTVKYTYNTNSSFPSSATTAYTKSASLSAAGNYLIVITDSAGNSTSYTFTIDLTAPTLTLSGVSNGGFTNGSVSASWSTTASGVASTALANSYDALTVKYSYLTSSTFPSSASTSYTKSDSLSVAGNYLIVITDSAGNSTSYTFTIDKTAPTLTLSGVTNGGFTNTGVSATWSTSVEGVSGALANSGDALTVTYASDTSSAFPTSASTSYASGTSLSDSGNYLIIITDLAGNSTSYTFTIDKTAPTLTLSGVTNGGFTNTGVSASWSTTVNGVTSARSNSNDVLTVTYASNTSALFPTSASTSYASGTSLSDAGNYLMIITDSAGNTTSYTFTIDLTAPTLTLTGVSDGGFTNGSVSASWSTSVEGVSGALANSVDALTVTYSSDTSGSFPSSASTSYASGTSLSDAGNYLIVIKDSAGNCTTYTFTIDKTAPTLTLTGVTDGGFTKSAASASWSTSASGVDSTACANSNDVLTVMYSYSTTSSFPTSASTAYTKNSELGTDGRYYMIISDLAGNSTTYTFTVDRTAPVLTFSGINYTNGERLYTNTAFSFTVSDFTSTTIYYTLNDETLSVSGNSFVSATPQNDVGLSYTVYVTDEASNKSTVYYVYVYLRSAFENAVTIKQAYTVASWYEAVLPSKYYASNADYPAGTYYFATYDDALDFAMLAEWSRVTVTSSGWSYSSVATASTFIEYTDYDTLYAAMEYYAASRISDRQILSQTGSGPDNTDGRLTLQNLTYPSILSDYSSYDLFIISANYSYTQPTLGVSGNTCYATISYISDGYSLRTNSAISLTYDVRLKTILANADCYYQGYYFVTEYDLCGNISYYVVYLDLESPQLTASAEYGNGTKENITIDADYLATYTGIMRYVSFDLSEILDNVDVAIYISIEGHSLSSTYLYGADELPVLTYDNGYYGTYTITIYDRSLNMLSFTVTIAGEAPSISTTSLTNETRVKVTVTINDSDNVLTEIHLYKISYSGEYTEMFEDSDGTAVSTSTLSYILRTGGKYAVTLVDAFGRTVEGEPFFYMKGLPSGTLSGVKDGGITNSDVTFKYSTSNSVILYVYVSGEWVEAGEALYSITEGSSTNTLAIQGSETTSAEYLIFLYVTDDMNLFVEYTFEVDCIAPEVTIMTAEVGEIAQDTVTRYDFLVTWDELNLTVKYATSKTALTSTKYTKNTYLTTAATYYFTVTDSAGNAISFEITLDNYINYTLEGSYTVYDEGYVSKKSITLTVNEQIGNWECISDNGLTVINGQSITANGIYDINVSDIYGNTLSLTLIIDNLAPDPVITALDGSTISADGYTNKTFAVSSAETGATITYSSGGTSYVVYNGETISETGTHYFKIADKYGNTLAFTVTLDIVVDYTIGGNYTLYNDVYYFKSYFTVTINEKYSSFLVQSSNDYTFSSGDKVSTEGVYTVTATDLAGNVAVLNLIVDKTAPVPAITAENGSLVDMDSSVNQAFTVTGEEGSTITYSLSGSSYAAYDGSALSDEQTFYFKITDIAGNTTSFTVTCDYTVKYTVSGTYTQLDNNSYITSKTSAYITVNESYSSFEVSNADGYAFTSGEKIKNEGFYTVTITDLAGNVAVISFEVDLTAPIPTITAENGSLVDMDSSVNQAFAVTGEEGDTITYSLSGSSYAAYDGSALSDEQTYYFKITDIVGNTTSFTVTCDYTVKYTVSGTYTQLSDYSYITSKTSAYITVNESYSSFEVSNADGYAFTSGEKIKNEGVYTVTITDLAGNVVVISFEVDLTAPVPAITAENGSLVDMDSSVNQAFTVTGEEGSTITYSLDGSSYGAYDGNALSDEQTYYFKIVDVAGNSTLFTVTCDYTVKYTVSGTYTQLSDYSYITNRTSAYITVNESYAGFEVLNADGFTFTSGEKIINEGTYTVTITDLAGNIAVISFEVDLTAPVPTITASDGSSVDMDSSVNQAFTVTGEESDTITYSLSGSSYTAYDGSALSDEQTYYFKITDLAGNSTSFTVTCDYTVKYTVSGTYVQLSDNSYITSKTSTYITVNESYSSFEVVNTDGYTFASGEKIINEGVYTVTITDLAGNVIVISFEVDLTAPVPAITAENGSSVDMDGKINMAFTVTAEEGATITYSLNGTSYSPYDGSMLEEKRTYYFKIADVAGNVTSFTVTCDYVISLTISGSYNLYENVYYFKSYFTVTVNEAYVSFVVQSSNEVTFGSGEKVSTEGEYFVTITDAAGNVVELSLVIDKTAPVPTITASDGSLVDMDSSVNQAFTVTGEEGSTINYSLSGSSYTAYDGSALSDEQTFYFKITDIAGNTTSFTVTCDYTVKYTVSGTYVQLSENSYITSKTSTYITVNESYAGFEVVNADDYTFASGEKITNEGVYTVTITDLAGNVAVISFEVDLTAPVPTITEENGSLVDMDSSVNQAFTVTGEEGSTITYSLSGSSYGAYDGSALSDEQTYYFKITDIAGNTTMFTVTCDYTIKYTVSGTYTQLEDDSYITNKTNAYITVNEDYTSFKVVNADDYAFTSGEKIKNEGVYTVTITDLAGNVVVISFEVDLTAPVPAITASDGSLVDMDSSVNQAFTVTGEEGSTITYSLDGSSYGAYDGSALSDEQIYYFKITDIAGNTTTFTVTCDYTVKYTVSGTYTQIGFNSYITNKTNAYITVNESYAGFEVVNADDYTFTSGEKITNEGAYTVTITDLAGNIAVISFEVDLTAPVPTIIAENGSLVDMDSSVNKSFTVTGEEGSTIKYSLNGTSYAVYDGNELSGEQTYYFKITDLAGNITSFTVTCDYTVKYTVSGTYTQLGVNSYITNKANAYITAKEADSSFFVQSSNDYTFGSGEKITDEGIYIVTITDPAGNVAVITFEVDFTVPGITLSGVENGGTVSGAVTLAFSEIVTATATIRGGESFEVIDGGEYTQEGTYTITAVDRAGNKSSATFTIDTSVDVKLSRELAFGQIFTGDITFSFNETLTAELYKDGEKLTYSGGKINETGAYTLKLTDAYGNTVNYAWYIVVDAAQSYELNIPDGYDVEAFKDGALYGAATGGTITLSENGEYELLFSSETEDAFTLSLTVDSVAPTVEIVQEGNSVIINNPSKTVSVALYKDGKLVSYRLGEEITDTGSYELIITDELGNVNVYTFTLQYINAFGVAAISVGCTAVLAIIIALIVYRRRLSVR